MARPALHHRYAAPLASRAARALVLALVVAVPGSVARAGDRGAQPEPADLIGALLDAPAVRERNREGTREPAVETERADEAPAARDRDELEKAAAAAHDDDDGYLEGSEALEELAKLDWPRAAPLLRRFAAGKQPRRAALALALTYRHEVAAGGAAAGDVLRRKLQAIATDRKQPGAARDATFEALLATEWPGRDDWYLAQFADPTLRPLRDGVLSSPLAEPVAREPDRWIPVMTRLLASPDRAVHDQAVTCLVQFHLGKARADALRPLLPWLADPRWSSAEDRLRLIQSLDQLDMKEAVPGLIALLGQRPTAQHDEFERSYAAETLAHFRDPRAVPALGRAISREKRWDHLKRLYKGLVASGGVPPEKAAAALEAAARHTATPAGREAVDGLDFIDEISFPPAVALGLFLGRGPAPEEAAVERLVARARALDHTEPATAAALRDIFDRWQSAAADRDLARRLEAGQLSARSVRQALDKRASLRRNADAELRKVAGRGDRSAAVAAVLLGDAKAMMGLLGGTNADARAMLLVCARLVGEKLPLDRVGALLASREGHVPDAAEGYLRADDSREAQRALLAATGGQARILGNRTEGDPGHVSFVEFDHIEEALRRSVLEPGGPDEILALLSAGYWGGRGQIIVHAKGGKARLEFVPDEARLFERDLTAAETLASLRALLVAKKVDALGPLDTAVADGVQLELVRLTKAGGRRVFMNNPDLFKGVYAELCRAFRSLLEAPGLALRYELAKYLPGLEILVADPAWQVAGVILDGQQPIIEVVSEAPGWGADMSLPKGARLARPAPPPEERAHLWLTWPSAQPVAAERLGPLSLTDQELPKKLERQAWLNKHGWANRRDGAAYVVGTVAGKDGLWRLAGGRAPALVAAGSLASPVLSRDGRWVLAARTQTSWAQPNDVVRIDTRTGRIQRVDIPAADNLEPIITTPQGVLVVRSRDDDDALPAGSKLAGPERPEYFVVDPETARVRMVSGDFNPIPGDSRHPFQPAGGDRIWAAKWDQAMQASLLGRYDLRRFVFTPVMELRGLRVGTDDVWVDEPAARVYAVYGGHLLRFPLGH